MARRRLNTILATTTLAAGLSVAPAWGQSLDDTSDPGEPAVEDTTATVEDTTGTVAGTDAVTEADDDGEPGRTEGTSTDDGEDPPVSTDLEADVAPEDEDGSPQLEVDGGVTVDDHTVDVGSATDPIEDAVDPDPKPSDDETPPGPSEDGQGSTDDSASSGSGSDSDGVLGGGAVTAAGDDPRSAGAPGSGSSNRDGNPSSSVMGESVAALAAENRGTDRSRGSTGRSQSDTTTELQQPQVSDPQGETFPRSTVEEPSVLATPAAAGDSSGPMAALLKSLAALMIMGTGVVLKRTLDDPA